ncbi:MAG: hypothetical protein V7604_298 [Hyphomicrobiales bacterium]
MELPERGSADTADDHTNEPTYSFKSSLMGAGFEFRLADDALAWSRGGQSGHVPYRRIRRVRLSFRPMTTQSYRFVTEIWAADGPKLQIASTSWKGMFEQERFDAGYRAFVVDLCRRIGLAGGEPSFETGSPPFIYWPGVAVFVAASIGLAGLIVRALMAQVWSGAAFVAAFLALFLWQAGSLFARNRPGRFSPEAVPPQVLPA